MKKQTIIQTICFTVNIAVTSAVFSAASFTESVFLKDGSIIKGKIAGEDDSGIILDTGAAEKSSIARRDILRILVHERYSIRIFLTQIGGITIEGYIVNEDNENITLRTKLSSPEEIKIPRERVETISTKRPEERILPAVMYSSVFTKNGEIIDCRIIRETASLIEVQPLEGERRIVSRNFIMRIQYNNRYKDRKVFTKTDGTRIAGYIMEEDDTSYTYRTDLYSPAEEKIFKSELRSIGRR